MGSGHAGKSLAQEIAEWPELNIEIVGFLDEEQSSPEHSTRSLRVGASRSEY